MGLRTYDAVESELYWLARDKRPVRPAHRCVALGMARRCRDEPTPDTPARWYFAGWQELAHLMGYTEWPNEAARKAVGRCLTDLENHGIIRRLNEYRGSKRVYEILPPRGGPHGTP